MIFEKKDTSNNLRPLMMSSPKTANRLRFEDASKKVHNEKLDNEVMNWIF